MEVTDMNKTMTMKEFIESEVHVAIIASGTRNVYVVKGLEAIQDGLKVIPVFGTSYYYQNPEEHIPYNLEHLGNILTKKDGIKIYVALDGGYYIKDQNVEDVKTTLQNSIANIVKGTNINELPELTDDIKENQKDSFMNGITALSDNEIIENSISWLQNEIIPAVLNKNKLHILSGYISADEAVRQQYDIESYVKLQLAKERYLAELEKGEMPVETKVYRLLRKLMKDGVKTAQVTFSFNDILVTEKIYITEVLNNYAWFIDNSFNKTKAFLEKYYLPVSMKQDNFRGFIPYIKEIKSRGKIVYSQVPKKVEYQIENKLVKDCRNIFCLNGGHIDMFEEIIDKVDLQVRTAIGNVPLYYFIIKACNNYNGQHTYKDRVRNILQKLQDAGCNLYDKEIRAEELLRAVGMAS